MMFNYSFQWSPLPRIDARDHTDAAMTHRADLPPPPLLPPPPPLSVQHRFESFSVLAQSLG